MADDAVFRQAARSQRQLNMKRSARPKHTIAQAPSTAACGIICASPAPCSMFARSASINAVKGSALMIGCTKSGNRCD